jgi:hypothetical protein
MRRATSRRRSGASEKKKAKKKKRKKLPNPTFQTQPRSASPLACPPRPLRPSNINSCVSQSLHSHLAVHLSCRLLCGERLVLLLHSQRPSRATKYTHHMNGVLVNCVGMTEFGFCGDVLFSSNSFAHKLVPMSIEGKQEKKETQ